MIQRGKGGWRSLCSSVHFNICERWTSQQEIQRKRQRLGRIRLPTPWFQALWMFFFVMRSVVFIYLSALSIGYWFMASPVLDNTRNAYNLPSARSLLVISALIAVCAVVYAVNLARMVHFSIKSKRLAFQPRQSSLQNVEPGPTATILHSTWSLFHRTYRKVFGPKGLLGIEHPYFVQLLMVRELVEIASQGYQVFTSSTLVPRRWVNDFSALLLIVNCWSTLVVHAFVPKPLTRQRVLCLAVDTLLDFTWSVVIPFCICLPYAIAYDPKLRAFPDLLLADSSWQLNWQMDIQQMCITSWMDFVAKMVPCISMLGSTGSIAGVIVEKRSIVHPERFRRPLVKQSGRNTIDEIPQLVDGKSVAKTPSAPSETVSSWRFTFSRRSSEQRNPRVSTNRGFLRRARQVSARLDLQSHFIFFILGVAIIVVHTYATVVANRAHVDPGCLVPMRPWFKQSYACAYASINCYASGIGAPANQSAKDDEALIATRLSAFDTETLRYLLLSHCAAVRMPPTIQKYPSLSMVEIYNSTIIEWSDAAAITTPTHPHLRRLRLVRTNLSSIPSGLLQDSPVVFMNLVATNLTTLPPEISSSWRSLKYLNMEQGLLREIPPAIASMETLERLSVSHNHITEIPKALHGSYSVLNFANNPLRALPETIRDPLKLTWLSFERTLVSDIPSWTIAAMTDDSFPTSVFGIDTPFCERQLQTHTEVQSAMPSNVSAIECATPSLYVDGYHPLAITDTLLGLP